MLNESLVLFVMYSAKIFPMNGLAYFFELVEMCFKVNFQGIKKKAVHLIYIKDV